MPNHAYITVITVIYVTGQIIEDLGTLCPVFDLWASIAMLRNSSLEAFACQAHDGHLAFTQVSRTTASCSNGSYHRLCIRHVTLLA